MRGKIPRGAAVFFCGVFFAVLALSAVIIVLHGDHDCAPGDYCPVCRGLRAAADLLKHCGSAPARSLSGSGFFGAEAEFLKSPSPGLTRPTAVSLKTRMNT